MAEHVAEEFDLDRLAAQVGLSNAPEELEPLPSFSGNGSTAALGAAVEMVKNKTSQQDLETKLELTANIICPIDPCPLSASYHRIPL